MPDVAMGGQSAGVTAANMDRDPADQARRLSRAWGVPITCDIVASPVAGKILVPDGVKTVRSGTARLFDQGSEPVYGPCCPADEQAVDGIQGQEPRGIVRRDTAPIEEGNAR